MSKLISRICRFFYDIFHMKQLRASFDSLYEENQILKQTLDNLLDDIAKTDKKIARYKKRIKELKEEIASKH